MKKIILIICLLPIFAFSQVSYKIIADSTILKSISTNSNELVIRNSTKDTTTSVLYNNGNGVTQFKKVRVIGLNDSTYVVKIGTLVVGDTIKIHLGVTQSALDDSINAVRSIRKVDTIYRTAGKDSIIYKINGLYHSIKDSLGGGENLQQTINNGSNITNPSIIVSNLNAGSPVDGVAFIIYPDTTNNTVSSFAYSNDFTHITGSQTKAIVGTNIQLVQMGIYDETSTLDTADLKLMFVNNAGVEKAYFTGLTTNNNTDKFIGVNSATKEIYEIDTSFYVSKNYLNSIGLGSVTSVATGYGLSGGPITTSGTLLVDTSNIASKTYVNSKVASSGGSSSLSSLTAATATNSIDNTNYKQRWNWNTIAGDTAFAILSTSTGAASNLQNLFTVALSGANATSSQTTYAANFSNTHTGTSSTNYAIRLSASGATNNYGLTSDADLLINGITAGRGKWQGTNSSYNTAFGYNALNSAGSGCTSNTAFGRDALAAITGSLQNTAVGNGAMGYATSYANCVGIGFYALSASTGSQNTAVGSSALTNQTSGIGNTSIGSAAGSQLTTGSNNTFLGASTLGSGSYRGLTECTLVGAFSGYALTGNTTTAVGYGTLYTKTSGANCVALGYKAGYNITTAANSVYIGNSLATSHATKNNIILLSDGSGNERVMIESDGRVGIGTTSPAASAVLDLTSTTQGFLPPRMTTTQRDAISSPATGLMIYDTTVNKISVYNGSTWKYLQYE